MRSPASTEDVPTASGILPILTPEAGIGEPLGGATAGALRVAAGGAGLRRDARRQWVDGPRERGQPLEENIVGLIVANVRGMGSPGAHGEQSYEGRR